MYYTVYIFLYMISGSFSKRTPERETDFGWYMRSPPHGRPKRGESAAKPTATGAPYRRLVGPVGRSVGFGVRFRIALAGHVVEVPRSFRSLLRRRGVCFGGSSDLPYKSPCVQSSKWLPICFTRLDPNWSEFEYI